ncbi:MAG: acetoin utilization protein AcuC [candidate division NC10 bacterium]|nr:acetoin utilization protein AcuC [candidate division NC10 bacterium]
MTSPSPPSPRSCLVYSPQFSQYHYGPSHPLRNERLALTFGLIQAYRLLELEGAAVLEPRRAREEELLRFHHADYLEALRRADSGDLFPSAYSYGLGTPDDPIFPGVFSWSVLVTGASLTAAEAIEEKGFHFAFNLAGGLHHAHPSSAAGFCYLNDPAVMIHDLVRRGRRVAYLDLDAHHGDGVQEAFYETDQVLTISLHESGLTLFPGTGFVQEMGRGKGEGYAVNLPLYPGTDDEIFHWAFQEIVPPLLSAFAPKVVVTQLGADSLCSDPLSNLCLSLQGFASLVRRIKELTDEGGWKWIALGGGGYDLNNVPRAWTLVWAIMNDRELNPKIPREFLEAARAQGFTTEHLWDPLPGEPRSTGDRALRYAREQVRALKETLFPLHGLKG